MEFTLYNHLFALIGSVASIATLILLHDVKIDSGKTNVKMKEFIRMNVLDFGYLVFIAQILVLMQEYFFNAYIDYKGIENGWDLYFNHEELFSFCVGTFGNVAFIAFFKIGTRKISKND